MDCMSSADARPAKTPRALSLPKGTNREKIGFGTPENHGCKRSACENPACPEPVEGQISVTGSGFDTPEKNRGRRSACENPACPEPVEGQISVTGSDFDTPENHGCRRSACENPACPEPAEGQFSVTGYGFDRLSHRKEGNPLRRAQPANYLRARSVQPLGG